MSGQPDNVVLVRSRRLDGKPDRALEEIDGVKARLPLVEAGLANVPEIAGPHHAHAAVQAGLDRADKRLHLQGAHP